MKEMDLIITVLGSGTSHGIPMIACDCAVCTSTDPRDKRSRTSITVASASPIRRDAKKETSGRDPEENARSTDRYNDRTTLLIDTGPELRLQCVANDIRRVDAVLYTHHHIDHISGLDDLRRFNWVQNRIIPCYGRPETLERLRTTFAYAFEHDPEYPSARPQLSLHAVDGPFEIPARQSQIGKPRPSARITPIPLLHGSMPVFGYRVGNFAYCTDVSEIPGESWELLEGLDVLILDALRKRPHPTHFNLEQAVEIARKIDANQTFFTHIAHELAHAETNRSLPDGMALAYDGQVIHTG